MELKRIASINKRKMIPRVESTPGEYAVNIVHNVNHCTFISGCMA